MANQQELPQWQNEEPTPAGPHAYDPDPASSSANNSVKRRQDGCCTKCVRRCGPIGWYFRPMFGKFWYSMLTAFYHLVMFPYTLAVQIIVITLWSTSVGLLILVFGFILYWWTCEIAVFLARIDLALAYYMVEDNRELIDHRSHSLKLSLYKRIAPCPCRRQGGSSSCCSATGSRMKSLALTWDTYKILAMQAVFKPLIVYATCWIFIIVVYCGASIFAPIVYICYPDVFLKHYWCPLAGQSCNDGVCECDGTNISINNFGEALLYGVCAFLVFPLVLHVNNWFAKASKVMSYYWLTNYYYGDDENDLERNNLLRNNNNNNNSVSNDVLETENQTQTPQIVHSLNNPYTDPAV